MKKLISLVCCVVVLSLSMTAFAETAGTVEKVAKAATTVKQIDVSATVDLGKNTKELLEQGGSAVTKIIEGLAKSLGMTVEKLFPYYVKQAYISGLMKILTWGGFEGGCLICILALLVISSSYGKKKNENFRDVSGFFAAVVFVIFGIGCIVGFINLSDWITLMKNPEYAAIQNMIGDARALIK
jgi:amino acid transporter